MPILFLIGPRGSGKTLAATLLSEQFAFRACDTDAIIRDVSGKTVAEIVEAGGWPAFRTLEKNALVEAVRRMKTDAAPAVIATGGGMVLDAENRARMRQEGVVAYLSAPAAVLAGRLSDLSSDASRPAFTSLPLEQEIAAVLRDRDSLYRETAHHVIDASLPPGAVVQTLYDHCRETV